MMKEKDEANGADNQRILRKFYVVWNINRVLISLQKAINVIYYIFCSRAHEKKNSGSDAH